jgi:hypothetical protein
MALPLVTFARRQVQPPGSTYVSDYHSLIWRLWSAQAGARCSLRVLFLTPRGQLQLLVDEVIPPTLRTELLRYVRLSEGFLLGATVRAQAATLDLPRRGQVFTSLSIGFGGPASPMTLVPLIDDYVGTDHWPAWPAGNIHHPLDGQGFLHSEAMANQSGVDLSWEVPTAARWKWHLGRFRLVTDATAVDRTVRITIDAGAGGSVWAFLGTGVVQAPSTAVNYDLGAYGAFGSMSTGAQAVAFPPDLYLPAASRVGTSVVGLQAGDVFSAIAALVEEWQEPQWSDA